MSSFWDLGKRTIKGNCCLSAGMFLSCNLGYSTYMRNTYLTSYKEIQHIKQDFDDITFSGCYRSHG